MITGKVLNPDGTTLPGAAVYYSTPAGISIGNIATTTDENGMFTLVPVSAGQYITVSYVGFNRITLLANMFNTITMTGGATLPEVEIKSTPKLNAKLVLGLIFAVGLLAYVSSHTTEPTNNK